MEYALHGWSLTIREKGSSEKKDRTQKTPSRGRNSTREDTEAIQRALDRFSASPSSHRDTRIYRTTPDEDRIRLDGQRGFKIGSGQSK